MTGNARQVHHFRAPAGDLHHLPFPEPLRGEVWVLEPSRPALVTGSTQALSEAATTAATAAGLDVTSRRSGGGAVLLYPGVGLWIDVFVAPDDRLFSSDIGVAAHQVGRCWANALGELGCGGELWTGPMAAGRWGASACFAGLGPGEVQIDGRKVDGISQRRTRQGARVQCHALVRAQNAKGPGLQADLVDYLDLEGDEAASLRDHLSSAVGTIDVDPAELQSSFLRHLGPVHDA